MHLGILFLLLTPPVFAIGLTKYRADYRRYGHTTLLGVAAAFLAFLMPHLVLGYSFPMVLVPHTTIEIVGMSIMALGLLGCLWPLTHFSKGMWTGRQQPHLVKSGPYRYSRNPQYVTYFFFIAGYAVIGRTILAWVALALYWIVTHLLVLIEEEHLERRFGETYRRYRRTTPRYLLW
jgi:protein-S-isoprenylcysteine O-methyltransferase Ste14